MGPPPVRVLQHVLGVGRRRHRPARAWAGPQASLLPVLTPRAPQRVREASGAERGRSFRSDGHPSKVTANEQVASAKAPERLRCGARKEEDPCWRGGGHQAFARKSSGGLRDPVVVVASKAA
eukprot:453085-Prorocentrum_minimum.AAC.1